MLTNAFNIFVIGGGQLYQEAIVMPECSKIYLTSVLSEFKCDTFFTFDDIIKEKFTLAIHLKLPSPLQPCELTVFYRKQETSEDCIHTHASHLDDWDEYLLNVYLLK